MTLRLRSLLSVYGLSALLVPLASGAESSALTWTGADNSNWANALNWDPQQVPTGTDTVLLPNRSPEALFSGASLVADLQITGGQLYLSSGSEFSSEHFTLSDNGQIRGTGTFFLLQEGNWLGGHLGESAPLLVFAMAPEAPSPDTEGHTFIMGSAVFTIQDTSQDKFLGYHKLENLGIVQQTAAFETDSALIVNSGTWTLSQDDARIGDDFQTSHFINNSMLLATGSGQARIEPYLTQNDWVQVEGSLVFGGGGEFNSGSNTSLIYLVPPPDFPAALANGSPSLEFESGHYHFHSGSYLNNSNPNGMILITQGAQVLMEGTMTNSGITRVDNSSSLFLSAPMAQLGYFELDGGSTTTSGTMEVRGGRWSSGYLGGEFPDSLMVEALSSDPNLPETAGTLDLIDPDDQTSFLIDGHGSKTLAYLTVNNHGVVDQYDALVDSHQSVINNYGTWNFHGGSAIHADNSSLFQNPGQVYTFASSSDDDSSAYGLPAYVNINFINTGAFYALADTYFVKSYTQMIEGETSPLFFVGDGSTIIFNTGADIQGGWLMGEGILIGDMSIANTTVKPGYPVGPGDSMAMTSFQGGILNFENTITLAPDTTLELGIYGSGTGYHDQILIGGLFDINQAILKIKGPSDIADYITSSDYFPILDTYGSGEIIGLFAGAGNGDIIGIYDFDNIFLGHFNLFYSDFQVSLSNFEAVPEPSTWLLMVLGGLILACYLRRQIRSKASSV